MHIPTITPRQLHELVVAGQSIELIDVRSPVEFRAVHVGFARNVPLDQLDAAQFLSGRAGSEHPLYVICQSGRRGQQACQKFLAAGYTNIVNVEGGTLAWVAADLAVVRGQNAVSLERQVRMISGGLILAGSALALLHPLFLLVPACVGAGLLHSGVTDSCVMGLMLARMPWNRGSQPSPPAAAPAAPDPSQANTSCTSSS